MRPILGFVLFTGFLVACGGSDNHNSATCGDGVLSGNEQCDDGNTTSGDGCSSVCMKETPNTCGNGVVEVDKGEQCDDGNMADGDGCSSTCQNENINKCGNGHIDGSEMCDDGNGASNDGCSSACVVEAGYSCTGTPSVCAQSNGTCAAPFVVALVDNGGTLSGTGTGDTTMSTNQVPAMPCSGYNSGGAFDHIWSFTIPNTRDVTVTISGAATAFDSNVRVTTTACDLATLVKQSVDKAVCEDQTGGGEDETITFSALPAGTYYVVIDGYNDGEVGPYGFTVTAAPSTCGNGTVDADEYCDDGGTAPGDGCAANCTAESGYTCDGASPSTCASSCGNGTVDIIADEECDDGGTASGDRCSPTCTLEYDIAEVEPNDDAAHAQTITPVHHVIRGSLVAGDSDLYTFTLTEATNVTIETYDTVDAGHTYDGVGSLGTHIGCNVDDTQVRVFDSTGDVAMDDTAKWFDDDDGDQLCSYIGRADADGDTTQGTLPAGTYTIKVSPYTTHASPHYLMDISFSTPTPVAPNAGDLVINEFMAADNVSDTNCDGATTSTNDEFVELVNVTSHSIDLTGVTISDSVTVRHTFAAGATGSMTLDPGKAVVVWAGGAPACPNVTNWFVASGGQLGLNDTGGDTITVKNAAATTVTSYAYGDATINKSFNLNPDVTGTAYVLHDALTGAVGAYSPGKRSNGAAF
jgi:cysteine-rich repeat protein